MSLVASTHPNLDVDELLQNINSKDLQKIIKFLPALKDIDEDKLNYALELSKTLKNIDQFNDSICTTESHDGSKTIVCIPDKNNNKTFSLVNTQDYLKSRLECHELFAENIKSTAKLNLGAVTDILPNSGLVYAIQYFAEGDLVDDNTSNPIYSGDKFLILCIEPSFVRFTFMGETIENVGIPKTLFFLKLKRLSSKFNKQSILLQNGDPYEIATGYVACVKDLNITNNTIMFKAPYANVTSDIGHICWGSNLGKDVCRFKDISELYTLPYKYFADMRSSHGGTLSAAKARTLQNKPYNQDELQVLSRNGKPMTFEDWKKEIFSKMYNVRY